MSAELTGLCDALPSFGQSVIYNTAALVVGAIPYGAQLILQWICITILWRPEDNTSSPTSVPRARVFLLTVTLLMTISSTLVVAITAAQLILSGLIISDCHNSRPFFQYSLLDEPAWFTIPVFFNVLVGDTIMFWRAFMLWKNKRRMVYIPGVLLIFTSVNVLLEIVFVILQIKRFAEFDMPAFLSINLAFGLSCTTNLATNASIGYYIWQVSSSRWDPGQESIV
ncbi:hypothetical protein VNI00_018982 [Paramarasmius palmivorus]|uniref:Integral membrane protein n=1 Tax=Paramarasmius palmivorus TaxID=297713 RepID=A0AAW0AS11_9AGAR